MYRTTLVLAYKYGSQNTNEVIRMNKENRELKIDEVLEELYSLRDENSFLKRQNTALKMRCSNYCLKVKDLENEVAELNFSNCLNGNDFARSFGVGGE